MPFTFEPAGKAELDTALAIARAASESPFSHWDAEYPNREILGEDIAHCELYFLRENGRPIAMISILDEAEEAIEFPWPEVREHTCMLARLGILPEAQGRGLAAETMRLAAESAAPRLHHRAAVGLRGQPAHQPHLSKARIQAEGPRAPLGLRGFRWV